MRVNLIAGHETRAQQSRLEEFLDLGSTVFVKPLVIGSGTEYFAWLGVETCQDTWTPCNYEVPTFVILNFDSMLAD